MTGGDPEGFFESEYLGKARHHEQCDDRGKLICGDAVSRKRGGEGLQLGGAKALGVAGDLDTDHFSVVGEGDELN